MIWRDGVLPPDAPGFSPQLSYDLHSYGYILLGLGLRLRELGGDPARARVAFEQAATALEAVMSKGARGETDRDFHFVMAAAAYHLARLSARAYSLLTIVRGEDNFSPIERALAQLMLRDFNALTDHGSGISTSRHRKRCTDHGRTSGHQMGSGPVGGDPRTPSFIFDGIDLGADRTASSPQYRSFVGPRAW